MLTAFYTILESAESAMQEKQPILVWTMGKVGTTTVSRALARAGIPALHMHSVRPEEHTRISMLNGVAPLHVKASLRAIELIKESTGTIQIITMVRDPVARNISAFFENLKHFEADPDMPTNKLIAIFEERYPHHVPLQWFDRELKRGVGFDIFAESFDHHARFTCYSSGRFKILTIRIDADLSVQRIEISRFVGVPVDLVIGNAANSKKYNSAYHKFKNEIVLSEEYVDRMYSSVFARHFWTGAELDQMSSKHIKRRS